MENIERDMSEVKNIVRLTYRVVLDSRYKEGIEKVDAAFQNFIEGSSNLKDFFELNKYFISELQTIAIQSLNPDKVHTYLTAVMDSQGIGMCEQVFNYVIVVRAKYLQFHTAFYIFRSDSDRVAKEFEKFNKEYKELLEIYQKVAGAEFVPGRTAPSKMMQHCQLRSVPDVAQSMDHLASRGDKELEEFLNKLGLPQFYNTFLEEEVTLKILKTCDESDLKSLGVSKFGQRRAIKQAISEMQETPSLRVVSEGNILVFRACTTLSYPDIFYCI